MYIDDVILYGKDEDEFLMNIRTVFERFRRFRITLNPKKCKLDLNRVEYVGRIIDDTGISFSKEITYTPKGFKIIYRFNRIF